MNRYKLFFIEGVSQLDIKWKNYPKENLKKNILKIQDYSIGRDTRFKKKKNTLKKKALNSVTSLNELYPYLETSLED